MVLKQNNQSGLLSQASQHDNLNDIVTTDPYLAPYEKKINHRIAHIRDTEKKLTSGKTSLADFASGHEFFGLHFSGNEWIFREWAPNATAIYLIGDMTGWEEKKTFALVKTGDDGIWEVRLPARYLSHGDFYRLRVHWPGGSGDRIPAYARRVTQDHRTMIFNAQVWEPQSPFEWKYPDCIPTSKPPFIYEAHVGIAQEEEKTGSYSEFTKNIIPKILKAGYNTLQLMAIQEHPYYGSFGYQVSSFFAASSRFGTPEDLKKLIDTAHAAGLVVIIDLVHSHSVSNEVEGLSRFDGTVFQYFHAGPRGFHHAWDSRCFDYSKYQVLHFLLSNCRFWLDEYHIDGFRFDGVTSMLYFHHGQSKAFTTYNDYFDDSVDEDALTYLALANKVIHEVRPDALTIAEDISGIPGLAFPLSRGGFGFDYRFAMGIPDNWIKLIKEVSDEHWSMGNLWYELNNRRSEEKTISYAESHDQAIVGDQSLIFRLIGADMYEHMQIGDDNIQVARGIALHKMIRFITLFTAGNGYLNFMGNEFGHPEWIDFPREGNLWSYWYARRLWSLADDVNLKYHYLLLFDRDMITLAKSYSILKHPGPYLVYEHNDNKIIVFKRGDLFIVLNFHPTCSYSDYTFDAPPGKYRMIFNSDNQKYGGYDRLIPDQEHQTFSEVLNGTQRCRINLYLPTRTVMVLKQIH